MNEAQMIAPGPSDLWVLIEEDPDSIDDGGFAFWMPLYGSGTSTAWFNYPARIHGKMSSCLAFADGHTEIHRWLDLADIGYPNYIHYDAGGGHPQIAPPDPDVAWLAVRTSAPGP
jgi:hypothetical protein